MKKVIPHTQQVAADRKFVSDAVKQLLQERKMDQKQLAKEIAVSENGLSKMLKRGTFKSDVMIKIAEFFNVDISFFNSRSPNKSNIREGVHAVKETENTVENLKEIIQSKEQTIEALKEALRSKDEYISTLKEKKT